MSIEPMKVLVANRGEIAVRILRSCRELGFPSVAVFSEADREALHTRIADESIYIGPAPASESYLNINTIIEAAKISGANAVHPGYGFLSENTEFAQAVEQAGMIFIGPRPDTIAATGDKLIARKLAREAGLPVLPGPDFPITEEIPPELMNQVKYPVLVKAVAGGGGRGIRLANSPQELEDMVRAASAEAMAAFGDDAVYLEPLVQNARHIEVQILGDGEGNVLCLGERECSIQRRRQKLIEECPAPSLTDPQRKKIYDYALRLSRHLHYRSLGTIEFLLDSEGNLYFIECNPRIQVEHPVTEMVVGVDLVSAQLILAATGILPYTPDQIRMHGAAIEVRVLAEDPDMGFIPVAGEISYLKEPGGPGIRVDSALYQGMPVTTNYDSLIAKVIAWGEDRDRAIRRLRRALMEFQIGGVPTDIDFLLQILASEKFIHARADTTYLDTFTIAPMDGQELFEKELALAAVLLAEQEKYNVTQGLDQTPMSYWRMTAWREQLRG